MSTYQQEQLAIRLELGKQAHMHCCASCSAFFICAAGWQGRWHADCLLPDPCSSCGAITGEGASSYYTAEQEQAWLDTFTPEWQRWP